MTSPVGDRMRYLPKPSRSLSGSHVFCLYGVYRVGPSIQKVCHSTIYTCLPPLKALGAATITGSSAASVVIAPTCHYATSAAGTGTASASAKERISGSLDLPNGFQYAYTVSLYTHDSGSQVIDDSTIGGRWKTRLSESLPGGH
uniref:Uncharacterized protein n=1 Tax=Ficus carica TaxID=3494 RepID=A0AA87ZQ51_FICCA|nr:hypothetical protein TIFTF001_049645 [Ficus carica]